MTEFEGNEDEYQKLLDEHQANARQRLAVGAALIEACAEGLASEAEISLRERVWSLTHGSTGERRAEVFQGLCELVCQVFPDPQLTTPQILASSATPDLMRYFIASIHRFASTKNATPEKLGSAFLATNPKSRPSKTDLLGKEMRYAAFEAHDATITAGKDRTSAYQDALEAAYQVFREDEKDPNGQDDHDRRDTLKIIAEMLEREGLPKPPTKSP